MDADLRPCSARDLLDAAIDFAGLLVLGIVLTVSASAVATIFQGITP